ncbi:ParA family protein [Halocatena salina]|uniref:ParA family protein n=1 Tax=Halocatena salina TaxID=2934340 RepID=A0A8U0AA67_9EURY|nr:ParA family protein [Halocatena salina]UPM44843.1 ParA family protein [Halocatena salina]
MSKTLRAASFLDKGGVGKTTSTAHLAVALEEQGKDVLLLDLAGKQGDLSKHFGVWSEYQDRIADDDAWPNIATVFDESWGTIKKKLGDQATKDLILATGEGPDIIPAHPGLDSLDGDLGNIDNARDRYSRLDGFLDSDVDPLGYDAVLIDLPGLSNNICYNGLWAAKNVVVPIEPGSFEDGQAEQLERDLEKIGNNFGVEISLSLVLPNKIDTRRTLDRDYLEIFEEKFPESIAPEHVPYSQDIRNATESGQTAFAIDEPSTTADRAQSAYLSAASTLLDRLED